jgi:prepilin-type N-terminal cleavage/methylation domain-containing protein
MPYRRSRAGFTLIEMMVVLLIMGMAAALAAPALLRSRPVESGLSALVANARETAIRRGETVYLRIGQSGQWIIEGAASSGAGALVSGQVDPIPGAPLTLLVTPTGSCALDVPSTAAAPAIQLDPLTCNVVGSPSPASSAPTP